MSSRQPGGRGCIQAQLMDSPEWSVLTQAEIELVEKTCIISKYDTGELIFNEGDICRGIYIIKDGLVSVHKAGLDGSSSLLRVIPSGDTLGYRALLAKQNHRASAEALEPTTSCFLEKSVVIRLLQNNQILMNKFLERVAMELGDAQRRFHESVTLRVKTRLMLLLISLYDKSDGIRENGKLMMELPISRRDLASMLGIRGESLSRAIHDLRDEGLVHIMDRHIEMHDAVRHEFLANRSSV